MKKKWLKLNILTYFFRERGRRGRETLVGERDISSLPLVRPPTRELGLQPGHVP